jgi:PTH1 family peptidyl-tRNA hydrolase
MDAIRFVVGLGNPGRKYENTPHNLGRRLADFLKERDGLAWKKEALYEWTDSKPSSIRLETYMNLSGEAVREILRRFRGTPESLLVCVDDFDLPLGAIRLRRKGSAGTHNGLKSIIEQLGTQDFPRLRLGCGPLNPGEDPAGFVLRPFRKDQEPEVRSMIEKAASSVDAAVSEGIEKAMNRFNA